jgi:hypothetical protein
MATDVHRRGKLEPPGVHVGGVMLTACASLLLVGVAVAGLAAVYRAYVPNPSPPPPQAFPQPQVRPDEAEQLRRLLAEQRARLDGYAWADRDKGLVQVPIDRAMQLLVQKGAQAWDPLLPANPALTGPSAGAQRAVTSGQGAPPGAAASDPNGEAKP